MAGAGKSGQRRKPGRPRAARVADLPRASVGIQLRKSFCHFLLGLYRRVDALLDRLGFDPIDETTIEQVRAELDELEPDESMGPILTRVDAPRLFELLDRLQRKMSCALPAEVRLSYLPACGILETRLQTLSRRPVLVVGLPCLHVWSIDELRAVLAHELVHLRFEDATFARDVLEMTRGLRSRLAESIDRPGGRWRRRWALVCVSLVEWMARPVSRWMEFRADEVSARACGSLALQSALEKLAMVQPIFREILTQSSTLATANVYRLFAKAWKRLAQGDYESLRQRLLKPSAEESGLHPPVSQRIDRLRHLPQQKPREFFPALHLLDDPKQLERVLHNRLFAFESPIARKSPHSPREGRRDDR